MGGNADTGNGFFTCWSISRFVALYLIKNKSDFDDTEDEDAMKWATRGSSTGRPSSSVRWMSAAEIAESKLLCSSSDGWTGSWWRLVAHLRHSIITVHSRFPDYFVFGGFYEK